MRPPRNMGISLKTPHMISRARTGDACMTGETARRSTKAPRVPFSNFLSFTWPLYKVGGGPRVVVSTAAFHARVRGSVPGLGGLKETKLFLPHPRVKVSIVGSLRDREVACSASDRQGSNFESCVWRTVSSQSSHHPQEVLLAQFSLYVHKGGLKPDSFHLFLYKVRLESRSVTIWEVLSNWAKVRLANHNLRMRASFLGFSVFRLLVFITSSILIHVDELALAWIMAHDPAKYMCASELGPLEDLSAIEFV